MQNPLIIAIEKAEQGYWDEAHMIVQQMNDPIANWLHANLHREEGDIDNAKYWYHQAIREYSDTDIETERNQILQFLKSE